MFLTHTPYNELDEGRDMTAVFLDISKYFDKIWHDGLLHKCKNDFLLSGTNLQWLGSYLTDRTQQIRVGDAFSTAETIRAGCPQGSVLGPLLALMYLDGLTDKVTNEILFYADDTSLYASHTTADIDTVQKSLQRDLDTIEEYARQWAIKFNSSKTTQMTFSHKPHCQTPALRFSGEIISSEADTHKHLGITFSKDLRFHKHVNNIIKKANIALSPLYPIAKHLHRTTLSHIYSTYVRPHFDYCDIVFDGHITLQDEMRLEKVQSRAAKLVTGAPFRTSTEKLRHDLGWETLKTRRTIHKQLFFHRLTNTKNQQPGYIREILPELRFQNTGKTLETPEHTHYQPTKQHPSNDHSSQTLLEHGTGCQKHFEHRTHYLNSKKASLAHSEPLIPLHTSHSAQSLEIHITLKSGQEVYSSIVIFISLKLSVLHDVCVATNQKPYNILSSIAHFSKI